MSLLRKLCIVFVRKLFVVENRKTHLSIISNTYFYLTILLLILPIKWILAWLAAIIFHECCHWIAVKLCGGTVLSLRIGLGGAEMQCSNIPERYRFIALLCGPIGGILLSCFGRWIPRIALCSFVLSLYNLLPLFPLDGGHALKIILKSEKIFEKMQRIVLLSIVLMALFLTFSLHLGIFPLVIAFCLVIKNRNSPCKEMICRVQ